VDGKTPGWEAPEPIFHQDNVAEEASGTAIEKDGQCLGSFKPDGGATSDGSLYLLIYI
jgi:hypothetical protein